MNSKSYPNKLYKYRIWENTYHKRLLTHNEIYFSSILSFNDPFEGIIPIRYDLLSEEDILKISTGLTRKKYPWMEHKKAKSLAKRKILKSSRYWENYREMTRVQHNYRIEKFGIFSLTEDPHNIVMWSHYADSHKGICAGFDMQEFNKYRGTIFTHSGIIIDLHKIEYEDKFPVFERDKMSVEDHGVKPLITKSEYWNYEKEWRMISINNNSNIPLKIRDGMISEIILGCRMSDKRREEIIEILRRKKSKISLFQASIRDSAFQLEWNRIEY
jgi:hypothetical protein